VRPEPRGAPMARMFGNLRIVEWMRRWPPALQRRAMWGVVLVIALCALAIALRAPIAERVYPEARAQQLRDAAELALRQGRLTAPDGTGARELYTAALALDPDRDEARVGLRKVGSAAIGRARAATDKKRFEEAHAALRLARELSMPSAEVDAIADRLRAREADAAGIDTLLADAEAAHVAGRLDGAPDAALPLYQRILSLQPDLNAALEGREDALSDLLAQAQAQLAAGKVIEAAAIVDRVREYDAGHVGLPDAQAALSKAGDRARTRGARALRTHQLDAAQTAYSNALALDPQDSAARDGLQRVALAWAARSEHQASDFRFDDAQRSLARARLLGADSTAIANAERHLVLSRTLQKRLPVAKVTPRRAAEVRRLIAEAAAAETRGDLLTPPGDSAYDHLRHARSLAPNDANVKRALSRLLPAAQRCFDDALRANRLLRAQACLDTREQLGDAATPLAEARTRLAARWIAVGEERLGAGEVESAQHAVDAARALDPKVEGLADFAERTRAAGLRR
jgi:tetratricopeptide (TPR) repeat protein